MTFREAMRVVKDAKGRGWTVRMQEGRQGEWEVSIEAGEAPWTPLHPQVYTNCDEYYQHTARVAGVKRKEDAR